MRLCDFPATTQKCAPTFSGFSQGFSGGAPIGTCPSHTFPSSAHLEVSGISVRGVIAEEIREKCLVYIEVREREREKQQQCTWRLRNVFISRSCWSPAELICAQLLEGHVGSAQGLRETPGDAVECAENVFPEKNQKCPFKCLYFNSCFASCSYPSSVGHSEPMYSLGTVTGIVKCVSSLFCPNSSLCASRADPHAHGGGSAQRIHLQEATQLDLCL